MPSFINEFAANPQVLPALIIFLLLALPVFGYFYNKLMDKLNGQKHEHLSLYVVIGVAVTILAGGLISWLAALMYLVLFFLSGLPMVIGEFKRTEQNRSTAKAKVLRRKRLPYAANGCIEDAHDAAKETQRLLGVAMKYNGKNVESAIPLAEASHQINLALSKIVELKLIQKVDD